MLRKLIVSLALGLAPAGAASSQMVESSGHYLYVWAGDRDKTGMDFIADH